MNEVITIGDIGLDIDDDIVTFQKKLAIIDQKYKKFLKGYKVDSNTESHSIIKWVTWVWGNYSQGEEDRTLYLSLLHDINPLNNCKETTLFFDIDIDAFKDNNVTVKMFDKELNDDLFNIFIMTHNKSLDSGYSDYIMNYNGYEIDIDNLDINRNHKFRISISIKGVNNQ